MKKTCIFAVILCLALLLSACGAKGGAASSSYLNDSGYYYVDKQDGYYDAPQESMTGGVSSSPSMASSASSGGYYSEPGKTSDATTSLSSADSSALDGRKMIKNGNFTVETLEYEKTIAELEALINRCGGYIQNSYVSGKSALDSDAYSARYANYTVRIPADGFSSFEDGLAACGSVLDRQVYIREVTDQYYDTEAHIKTLQAEEEQLLSLLSNAKELEGIIKIHDRLSDVRYQIESLQGTLRRLDNQISLSTITITIQEVREITRVREVPKTLGERISDRFAESWHAITSAVKNIVVFLVGDLLLIVFWCALIVAAILLIRHFVRKAKKKAAKKTSDAKDTKDAAENSEKAEASDGTKFVQ